MKFIVLASTFRRTYPRINKALEAMHLLQGRLRDKKHGLTMFRHYTPQLVEMWKWYSRDFTGSKFTATWNKIGDRQQN